MFLDRLGLAMATVEELKRPVRRETRSQIRKLLLLLAPCRCLLPSVEIWWSWPGLNRRPRECHSRALPTALQPHVG